MVKDHSDSKRGNLLPHRLYFLISSKDFLYASSHRQDNTYHSLCAALAGTRNSSMGILFWDTGVAKWCKQPHDTQSD